jgi:hypothetical protein
MSYFVNNLVVSELLVDAVIDMILSLLLYLSDDRNAG